MGTVVLEEYELLGDAKYRSYVTAIDKALKSFESTSEWADLISALGKLNKVLLSNARYQVIPRRLTVSKRLAQCMHPALPSGVHLKALETYDLMLRSAGPQRLGQELFLYSAGLFPLLAHAAMNVRPALLALYETHFLPLGERLRPGLNGFLIGVLPGLEEGSDHYDRTDALLLDVCLSVEKSYFYGSLWKCVLCNPAVRLAAINFIISHYNRRQSMEDQLFIIGTDINCMVQGLCAALQDTSVLVQRSALELLLLGFPLHSCQLVAADRVRVCTAAVVVLLRRDMSLNRRLFAWLFGSDGSTTTSGVAASPPATTSTAAIPDTIDASTASASTYFYTNSCALLLEALKCLFSPSTCRAPVLSSNFSVFWPYRILVSLMDKPEITTAILDDILIDVFRSLYLECSSGTLAKSQQEKQADRTHFELVKTANLLFSSLEPDYLWGYVAKSFHGACVRRSADPLPRTLQSGKVAPVGSGAPTLQEVCILSEFLLEVISMDSYMETEHLPDLLHSVAEDLREHCSCLHPPELKSALVLCSRLLSKVQPSLQPGGSEAVPGTTSRSSQPDTCLEQAVPPGGADDLCSATMMANCVASFQRLFLRFVELWVLVQPQETLALFGSALLHKRTMQEGPEGTGGLPDWLRQLLMLSCFAPDQDLLISTTTTVLELLELSRTAAAALEPSFRDVSRCLTPGGSQATLAIVVVPMVRPSDLSAVLEQTRFVRVVAGRLWELLEPHREALHLRAVELLQLLHNVAPEGDGACEDVLCRALSSEDEQEQTEAQKRFSILWNLSRNLKFKSTPSSLVRSFDRCLFQMLHCLSRPWGPQRAASQVWLNHSLLRGDLARLLEPPMMVLLHPDTARISVQHVSVHSGMAATVEPVPVLARDEASSSEARIFAISSVGGNVIYHVDKAKVAAGAVAPLASVNPEKRVLALTSIVGPEKGNGSKLQVVTRSSKVDVEFPPASLDSLHQMSLFVNPFGSLTSLTNDYLLDSYGYDAPDLSNATRIHGTSLRKSSFDEPDENAASDREDSAHEIVRSILDEIVDLATSIPKGLHDDDAAASDSVFHEESKRSSVGAFAGQPTAHPLHSHLLLYCQVFDSQKTLYALGVLKLVVESNPRAALCSMATTSVSSSLSQRGAQLQTLLARHRKSIFGNNFHGEMAPEALSGYRSSMFLEVLVSACLYFVRSYYPSLPQAHLTAAELSGNRDVRLLCCELLRLVFSEMVAVVRDSGRSFAVYLGDLLMRCKVQKALLHCLVASVYGFQQKTGSDGERAITTDIIEFNEKVPVGEGLAEDFQETFQVYLLQLIAALIIFEDRVAAQMGDDTHPAHKPSTDKVAQKTRFQPQMSTLRYQHGVPIPCQAMFGTATLTALRQQHKAQLHSHWLSLVMCALPFAGKCLTQLVLSVASQVCSNLEAVVSDRAGPGVQGEGVARPPDYLISLVEGLTLLCHYCLLDGDLNNRESGGSLDPILSTRRSLLSNLPRILAALVTVWEAVVKQHILSFLSPISLSYGSNFMAAVAVVWYERRKKNAVPQRKVIPQWSPDQLLLVELVSAIKVLPMDSVVQVVRQVLRQPPPTSHDKKHTPGTQLLESWSALLGLWKDGLQLTALPLVQFHLLGLLNEFVQRAPLLEDKKDQKDLQDITQKVIEACSTVASACLEQTTWLRRNLAVRPGPQPDILGSDADPEGIESPPSTSNFATSSHAQYSVQALSVLAEFLAPVLDVVYVSEEKEKVVPLLSSIMCYVTPYLRNRRLHNVPSFRACSQLVSSLSSYQYTRKAWKRDALELLLDAAFFQMDQPCMAHWRSIVDHLMTHDKTTFRDFLARFAVTQSGSLNIFSSKEQEYESRAQLLKRLAFILFCSEPDQYQRYMPDIQERLAESLKLSHVPAVQAQVFLCFRVLLLRMSPHQVTSLWPGIITELVQAFLQIEQELSTDSEAFGSHLRRLQGLDSSWAVSNGLNAHNHPAWLQLYLSACKLLDLAVALPADMLPQFQMYRWAFIGDNAPLLSSDGTQPLQDNSKSEHHEFVPHIMRLAALMNKNNPNYEPLVQRAGHPFLTLTSIKSLYDMQGFFNSLVDSSFRATELHASSGGLHRDAAFDVVASSSRSQELSKSRSAPELSSATTPSMATEESGLQTALQFVECVLEHDFLEARQS
ncbi:protein dopey-1, putative [Ixodes scapularis]|uniref:Protein dopey-1, putative n=1 Tax=Ixodes scapularis TaxID=6945 RepID=B7PZN7_IXOSC|nr:protein dopey-1, putative [Ixodes scapularis]|eukprot:XP_002405754.1 protein dopey-1, putative [Ixodes scapularis]